MRDALDVELLASFPANVQHDLSAVYCRHQAFHDDFGIFEFAVVVLLLRCAQHECQLCPRGQFDVRTHRLHLIGSRRCRAGMMPEQFDH